MLYQQLYLITKLTDNNKQLVLVLLVSVLVFISSLTNLDLTKIKIFFFLNQWSN